MRFLLTVTLSFCLVASIYHFWPLRSEPHNLLPVIKNPELDEVSGLVFSHKNKNLIWVHNDGWKKIQLYLIDTLGNTLKTYNSDIATYDWEDITIDTGVLDGKSYIYAGDIGDNFSWRSSIKIYRIPEPGLADEVTLNKIEQINLKYPDGPRDSEAMFVDPLTKQLYIITKREENVGLYTVSLAMKANQTYVLEKVGQVTMEGEGESKAVTGADISRDGSKILIRTYGAVFYWERKPHETVENALKKQSISLPFRYEVQGESIGFDLPGLKFFTISEGESSHLNANPISGRFQ